ncbi:gamma carbonic anhydrase family protein [Thermorudis peleae]|uniref:gamma carbonic anhydrase family protein n=1 Tax=Thermorudis peleae TaxID=1382356 RepID=UPI00056E4F41|nr:gamma carbonic anhydrase family protein [Thermorudis peleae]MBX6754677.1 gamma carbonic anhydrase family protein [Thermorudis peleae]
MAALLLPFGGKRPRVAADAFIAPTAVVLGDVEIGEQANLWFGVVVRGDIGPVRIGARTNLQEGVIVHVDEGYPTILEEDVTVGHGAIVHGAVVERGAQVGMGAILLTGSRIGAGAIVGAGAVVPEGMEVPPGSVVLGVPARVRREVSEAERAALLERAARYAARGQVLRALLAELAQGKETHDGDG